MSLLNTFDPIEKVDAVMKTAKKVYFIGIGGIGMRGLAEWTARLGYSVYGSDLAPVRLSGATVYNNHSAVQVEGMDAVIFTVAIREDNPEYVAARAKGIPLFSRANYLGWLMSGRKIRLSIAGTHGKSTTTAMIGEILYRRGLSPTVVGGAEMRAFGGAFSYGDGEIALAEACEYKDSFLSLSPTVAVALNIEEDHTDYFKSREQLEASFLRYLSSAGRIVINLDDKRLSTLAQQSGRPALTFSCQDRRADFYAQAITENNGKLYYTLYQKEKSQICGELPLSGLHNLENALAAITASYAVGVRAEDAVAELSRFFGVLRRMEYKGRFGGAFYYDDYAHHPTEIRSTLLAARKNTKGKLVCLFQSHTYSRSESFAAEFASALSLADELALLPIFAAREENNGADKAFAKTVGAPLLPDLNAAAAWLLNVTSAGDNVIVMGAGNANAVFSLLPLK